MRFRKMCAGIATVTLLCHPALGAQEMGLGLRGLSDIELAPYVSEEGVACNVSHDAVDAAMRLPLAGHLKVVPESQRRVDFAAVTVTVQRIDRGLCAGALEIDVYRWSTEFKTMVVVWQKTALFSGNPSEFGPTVHKTVEDLTKQMIAAWMKANM